MSLNGHRATDIVIVGMESQTQWTFTRLLQIGLLKASRSRRNSSTSTTSERKEKA